VLTDKGQARGLALRVAETGESGYPGRDKQRGDCHRKDGIRPQHDASPC
jgi:hypothetical protein